VETITGKYTEAVVFADSIEPSASAQIQTVVDQPAFAGITIRIMPDVHAGAGCVIGFTCDIKNKICPQTVGVDIGCGMIVRPIGRARIDYAEFDQFVHENIPSGFSVHPNATESMVMDTWIGEEVREIAGRIGGDAERYQKSVGTLGGGNHFIEIDVDTDGNRYLIVHSGSRKFGKDICNFHQKRAVERCERDGIDVQNDLAYLRGGDMSQYLCDMQVAQRYAEHNREAIVRILSRFLPCDNLFFHCTHNYISERDWILRKGAISAHEGEHVLIPLNMRDGCILGVGKGNPEWNFSAPHGSGRILGRKQAKRELSLADFESAMEGIYSSCVKSSTLDESPMAYKSFGTEEDMRAMLHDTVDVDAFLKPEYNFKATEEG